MSPRDTGTGHVLEAMILPALKHGRYSARTQVCVGKRCGGGRHVIDAIAERAGEQILISVKWQEVAGTAEQKVPFEVICLADAVLTNEYPRAYLVLGGPGWTLRDYYTSGGLAKHLVHAGLVKILSLEDFIGRANKGRL
jgi:hypothetical protein